MHPLHGQRGGLIAVGAILARGGQTIGSAGFMELLTRDELGA